MWERERRERTYSLWNGTIESTGRNTLVFVNASLDYDIAVDADRGEVVSAGGFIVYYDTAPFGVLRISLISIYLVTCPCGFGRMVTYDFRGFGSSS